MVFLNDDATQSTIYAPSAVPSGSVAAWSTKNPTTFVALTSFTEAQFNALTTAQKVQDAYVGTTVSKVSLTSAPKFYGIKTVTGKYAVLYVQTFTPTVDGAIVCKFVIQNDVIAK